MVNHSRPGRLAQRPWRRPKKQKLNMKTHVLKIWPDYFEGILCGNKTFEVRYNDRGYKYGDLLRLREYNNNRRVYTGREVTMRVKYVFNHFGLQPDWVVMAVISAGNARLHYSEGYIPDLYVTWISKR